MALACSLVLGNSASIAGVVDTLDPGDAVAYTTTGDLASWNNNGDTDDATFTLRVDFSSKASGGPEVLWESGGRVVGSSLLYVATDTLRLATRTGGVTSILDHTLTSDQISAGEIFVSWVFDLNNDEMKLITSHVNGIDHPEEVGSVAYTGNDWTGSGQAGFGDSSSAIGGYSPRIFGSAFTSGTINTTEGLLFYEGDAYAPSPIPEPMGGFAALGAAVLVLFLRRRSIV